MIKKNALLALFTLGMLGNQVFAQATHYQYFDGADTLKTSIHITLDPPNKSNVWQVGKPHKIIFNKAATVPNVIVTDTMKTYPVNNISRFSFHVDIPQYAGNIYAIRWKQKMDMDKHKDGGIIEFSFDKGTTWQNALNNPIVHNFYGFDYTSKDTLSSGEYALSGTDSTWKDVWFCIYTFSTPVPTSLDYRFTLKSDGTNTKKEGWMIDNLMAFQTHLHIVKENEKSKYLNVYPTATQGQVTIEALQIQDDHVIQKIELFGMDGRLIQEFKPEPSKLTIDISHLPNGIYYLKVDTNLQHEVFPLMLAK
jgi:hypothetical protein